MNNLIDKTLQNRYALQNIGPVSRIVRVVVGFALLYTAVQLLTTSGGVFSNLAVLATGIALVLSGITGWCPVRAVTHTKSCDIDGHAPCGTLPFQLDRLFHRS